MKGYGINHAGRRYMRLACQWIKDRGNGDRHRLTRTACNRDGSRREAGTRLAGYSGKAGLQGFCPPAVEGGAGMPAWRTSEMRR